MTRISDAWGKTYGSDTGPDPNSGFGPEAGNGGNGNGKKKKKRNNEWKDPRRLYRKLTDKHIFKAFRGDKNPEIVWYDKEAGVYRLGGEVKIKEELGILWHSASNSNEDILDENNNSHGNENEDPEAELDDDYAEPLSEHGRNEVVRLICWDNLVDRNDFDSDPDILNVKNGLLNIKTRELKPHTSEYLSLRQIPHNYDPSARSKEVLRTLSQILDKESLSMFIRFLGYILQTKSTIYHKALLLLGYGGNGKSVLTSLIEAMVGPDNCSHVRLQDLGPHKHMAAELFGKFVNTFADIPDLLIKDTSVFKAAVSGDSILGEKKFYNPFPFDNKAKFVYTANKIPSSFDESYGFYRRWEVILCRRLFEGKNKDVFLRQKLTTNEREMSGLLNLALVGLQKLIKEGGFADKPLDEIKAEFHKDDLTLKRFVDEECMMRTELEEKIEIENETQQFIDEYQAFCRKQNPPIAPMPSTRLEDELINKYGVSLRRRMVHYKKKYFFAGVMTRTEYDRRKQEYEEQLKTKNKQRQDGQSTLT